MTRRRRREPSESVSPRPRRREAPIHENGGNDRVQGMTGSDPAIVIAGRREDWPGGAKTLTPLDASREPNGTFWFGAELDPDVRQVWFRIDEEAIGRMPVETPKARGRRLVDALIVQIAADDGPLRFGINRFDVHVSEAGEVQVESLQW